MKTIVLGLVLISLMSCTSQNVQSDNQEHENNRNQEFIQQKSNEAAGKNIYQGSGLQIFKSK